MVRKWPLPCKNSSNGHWMQIIGVFGFLCVQAAQLPEDLLGRFMRKASEARIGRLIVKGSDGLLLW